VEWDKVTCNIEIYHSNITQVLPPPDEFYYNYHTLPERESKEKTREFLEKLIVVELNGGLGNHR
jgi:hypothetical protein